MNPIAAKYGAPPLVSVNLVPKELQEKRRLRAVQTLAVLIVVAAIAAVALGYFAALGARAVAQSNLDNKLHAQAEAIKDRDAQSPVYTQYLTRETQEYAIAQIGWGEIDMASYVAAIANEAAREDAAFVTIVILGPSAVGIGSGLQDPALGVGVGSVHFTAHAKSTAAATALIQRLEGVPGVASVRGTAEATTEEGGEVYWRIEGTALITPAALTGRLLPTESITGLSGDQILASLMGGSSTDPSPSPEPSPEATTEGEG